MSDVQFTVDPAALDALRGQLVGIVAGMSGIGQNSSGYSSLDLGPDAELGSALQDFHSSWSYGLATITHNVDALATVLARAAGAYSQVDSQIAGAAVPPTGAA